MSVLVTGGTGFIGAQVVRILLEKGVTRPVVFDINPSTKLLADAADRIEVVRGPTPRPSAPTLSWGW